MNPLYSHRREELVWGDKSGFIGYLIFRLQPTSKKKGFLIDSTIFKYRRKITITEQSGSDLDYYQVLIELNSTNFDFSHAQTNGEDIRFTDADENLLDYWIEEWDVVNKIAKVWVKVPSIPANSSVDIYMYYGNSSASSASDASATFFRVIDGLVASWHLDEGSGTTAYDTSGNDYDGALVNGPTWVDGKFGKALRFGGSDYVEVPDDESLRITGDISIIAWVKPVIDSDFHAIVSKGYSREYELSEDFRTGTYDLAWRHGDESKSYMKNFPNFFVDGEVWYFVAAVREGNELTVYKNGSYFDSDTFTESPGPSTNPVDIGKRPEEALNFGGIIDEVSLFNRALTQQEIQDLYNYYGYSTENYPGKVLVRKYASPEPSIFIGAEETA